MTPRTHRPRAGFTLLELLVVISIIAVLTALTSAGVMRAREAGTRTQAFHEITQLELAIAEFQTKMKVDYIPSQLKLCDSWSSYSTTNQLDIDSQTWLRTCWPHLGATVNWNGNGSTTDVVTLRGDQVLVFALGGINQQGFSTNAANPAAAFTTGSQRVGPFYTFPANRLVDVNGNGYPSFKDAWGKNVYAYFSTYAKLHGYNRYGSTDCTALGINPYIQSGSGATTKYWNEKGVQIISAGKDGLFGNGGQWPPADADEYDNQSNLSKSLMGGGLN